ncbi:MAG: radical SAM/SPASM domain-containing protein [Clostridia bacterium]|nr:radical SAM/SPASM domain-containing protein [Clostridia bacterium]
MKIRSFFGKPGFYLQKAFPRFCAYCYLTVQKSVQHPYIKRYIRNFSAEKGPKLPLCVSFETINKCNGTCAFCPANTAFDKRERTVMPPEIFDKAIDDLKNAGFNANLVMCINNEPLLDPLLTERLEKARRALPDAKIQIYTNGSLLTPEKLDEFRGLVDKIIINNYTEEYALNKNIRKLVEKVNDEPEQFSGTQIIVEIRYRNAVLSNRGGLSPNKKAVRQQKYPCVMPFSDIAIYSDGSVGICSCDFSGVLTLGNVKESNVIELFNGEKYARMRESVIKTGRPDCGICEVCDFVGRSNTRLKAIKRKIRGERPYFG